MKLGLTRLIVALALLCGGLTPHLSAQHVSEILGAALERYEQRMAGIENYTLTQDVMGLEVEGYYERREVDGRPVFVLAESNGVAGRKGDELASLYQEFAKVANRAELRGQEAVDGQDCYVLVVEDFSGVKMETEAEEFTPRKGSFYLDADEYVLRKLVIEGDFGIEEEPRPMTVNAVFDDFRDIAGMLHPFNTRVVLSGLTAQMSDEELEEARRTLEELRGRLESMPESQREKVQASLGPQIERLEEMVRSGTLEVSVVVKDLRVNVGPPERH